MSAMMHMIKSTIGGGFLAMPEAFHNAGLVVGTIGTMVLGVAVLNMMSFIVSILTFLFIKCKYLFYCVTFEHFH